MYGPGALRFYDFSYPNGGRTGRDDGQLRGSTPPRDVVGGSSPPQLQSLRSRRYADDASRGYTVDSYTPAAAAAVSSSFAVVAASNPMMSPSERLHVTEGSVGEYLPASELIAASRLQPMQAISSLPLLSPASAGAAPAAQAGQLLAAQRCIEANDMAGLSAAINGLSEELLSKPCGELNDASLLHHAIELHRVDAALKLIDAGASVGNTFNARRMSPMVLAMRKMPEVVPRMLELGRGKNVRRIDEEGRNLLHHVVWGKAQRVPWVRMPVVRALVCDHAVSCGQTDARGFTPAQWARENYLSLGAEADDIIAYLEAPPLENVDLQSRVANASFKQILIAPTSRLVCAATLAGLHAMQYCVDLTLRVDRTASFTFEYAFAVFNMVGSNWPTNNSTMLIAKLLCILFGALATPLIAWLLVHKLLLKRLLALRIFGAGTTAPDRNRGSLYLAFFFCFAGIYFGGLIYNEILHQHFPAREAEMRMRSDIGVSRQQALVGFAITTMICDSFVFLLIFDTMAQQVAKRIFLPFSGFATFFSSGHATYGSRRYLIFWLALSSMLFGVLFGIVYAWDTFTAENDPPIATRNPAQRVAITALCIFFDVAVMCQDWTMPYLHRIAAVKVPGFCFAANNSWLLWFVGTVMLALDGRMLLAELSAWVDADDFAGDPQRVALAMSLIPAGLGAALLLLTLLRNSLWWRCCGAVDDDAVQPLSGVLSVADDDVELGVAAAEHGTPPPYFSRAGLLAPQFAATPPRFGLSTPGAGGSPTPHHSNVTRVSQQQQQQSSPPSLHRGGITSDVWSFAFHDEVIRMCSQLDLDPNLINKRGGPGLFIDPHGKIVRLCSPPDPKFAAAPLHYAIAGNAKSTIAALISRGANPRLRTSHGMWTCRELSSVVGCLSFDELMTSP